MFRGGGDGENQDMDMLRFGLMTQRFHPNPTTNMVVCTGLMSMFGAVGSSWQNVRGPLASWMERNFWSRWRTHRINWVSKHDYEGVVEEEDEPRNKLLIKAITLYIGHLATTKLGAFPQARVELHAVGSNIKGATGRRYRGRTEKEDDPLDRYRISILPRADQNADEMSEWTPLVDGVKFKQSEWVDNKDSRNRVVQMELSGSGPKSDEKIREFVKKAWAYYIEEMRKQEEKDTKRYLYIPYKPPKGTDIDATDLYKRYPLADRKGFDSFFHHQKPALLKLLKNFMHKSGPFEKTGFPYKLGLLLHGPPGTGKTSFIKCLAKHTGRNIVTLNLAKIKTNQELADIMFDRRFRVLGEDEARNFEYEKLIYVLEDVDVASDVVKKRKGVAGDKKAEEEERERKRKLKEKEKKEAEKDSTVAVIAEMLGAATKQSGGSTGTTTGLSGWMKKDTSADKLNLSGLLNVLDGVVDTPGRIVVMTTNVVSDLDPALIRPGRINRVVEMGHMRKEQVSEMAEYYYGDPVPMKELSRRDTFRDGLFTPADVEQYCAECQDADGLLKRMRTVLRAVR